jgi:hypothetical protein
MYWNVNVNLSKTSSARRTMPCTKYAATPVQSEQQLTRIQNTVKTEKKFGVKQPIKIDYS